MKIPSSSIKRLARFIHERENVRILKATGAAPPWTRDSILQTYRFCNVHREDDAVTRWLTKEWRKPNKDDPDLWFALVVARHINNPSTLLNLGYCVPWNPKRYHRILKARKANGERIYNAAYMIVPSATKAPKNEYLEQQVYTPMWKARAKIRPRADDTLQSFFDRLIQYRGMGRFMAAQVIADLKYVQLRKAKDWWTFAASGPGSRRGMNRVMGRDPNAALSERKWKEELNDLAIAMEPELDFVLHAQDLQNCLCEFDKYERARTGQGKPKQLYKSGER